MLMNNTDYIDFSSPPLTVFERATRTTTSLAGDRTNSWPVGYQQIFLLSQSSIISVSCSPSPAGEDSVLCASSSW